MFGRHERRRASTLRCPVFEFCCQAMNEHLIADLGRFVDERGVTLSETSGHVSLSIVRSAASLSILIPRTVLEWWVEVLDAASGKKIEDWCDYSGYESTPDYELSEAMRADVVCFIENVLMRPLRVTQDGCVLEWHVGKDWLQAVPLMGDGEPGNADDGRNMSA